MFYRGLVTAPLAYRGSLFEGNWKGRNITIPRLINTNKIAYKSGPIRSLTVKENYIGSAVS